MGNTKRISEIITNGHGKLLAVATKARKRTTITKVPPPIGHYLAVMFFESLEHVGTLFMDNVDVCQSYTAFHIGRNRLEIYPVELESHSIDLSRATFYYKNNTSIQIIRI